MRGKGKQGKKKRRTREMVGIMMTRKHTTSNWWWLDNHCTSVKRSPWLQSTLSELEEKTEAMLALIEEDADSFAKRAEMYYKKRPELIGMVQDFYRAHRSLAERYDQIKSETPARLLTSLSSPFSGEKSRQEKPAMISITDQNYDSYSETFDHDEAAESEVDDPDEDYGSETTGRGTPRASVQEEDGSNARALIAGQVMEEGEEVRKLKEEIERMREENRIQREQLEEKDEEKREAIRQLSLAVGMLKEENLTLKKSIIGKVEVKKINKSKFTGDSFLRKLFNGSFLNSPTAIVAL
ncbi:hypothetical protein SAY86_010336 [Trapa natans]|uniref:NAB domain-containing protein n=1 Tax=Trapa natans TaxID=22666 RepID=A0AAN7L637_TRANT|nr:hypothetical protein SAY86_010336 [Trapa natans]